MNLLTSQLKKATILIAAMLIIATTLICHMYFIKASSGGIALWNTRETYLFLGSSERGLRVSYFWYPVVLVGAYFNVPEEPDDDNTKMVVFHITSTSLERHEIPLESDPARTPNMYTPLDGRIYVNYPARGGLCWWAGDHFQPATEEERLRGGPGGLNILTSGPLDDKNGWSRRYLAAVENSQFTISTSEKIEVSVSNVALHSGFPENTLSVQILRSGMAPQTIWNVAGRSGERVSRTEYWHIFRAR